MYSMNPQHGLGLQDIGPVLKLKRVYQRGAGCRKRLLNKQINTFYNPYTFHPQYPPRRNQYGSGLGIGGIFASALRYLAPKIGPLLSSGINAIKNELLSTGIDVLKNPTKENLKRRSLQAVDNLTEKVDKKIKLLSGSGVNKKRIKLKCRKKKTHSRVKRRVVKSKKRKTKIIRRGRTKFKKSVLKKDIFD